MKTQSISPHFGIDNISFRKFLQLFEQLAKWNYQHFNEFIRFQMLLWLLIRKYLRKSEIFSNKRTSTYTKEEITLVSPGSGDKLGEVNITLPSYPLQILAPLEDFVRLLFQFSESADF
jgi:hypothetical protein